jgi:hypothetical protein
MPIPGQGSGVCQHSYGYLQITRRGPYRNWLVHRKVMLDMCLEQCYYVLPIGKNGLPTLPDGMTVEHIDHRRQHNCRQNLMLLDKRIHDAISLDHGNMRRAMYRSIVVTDMPNWVEEDDISDPDDIVREELYREQEQDNAEI